AVDDGKLGGSLLALLEQALRLVEETGVFQRHAHAGGDGADQPDFRLAISVFTLIVLHRDHAERPIACEDGHEDGREALFGSRNGDHPLRAGIGPRMRDDRPARMHELPPDSLGPRLYRLPGRSLAMPVLVQEVKDIVLRVIPADAQVAGLEYLA